jgi:hypothetical protein
MGKFNLMDRLVYGSFNPRLAPRWFCNNGLNEKLGPRHPDPLVRQTGHSGPLSERNHAARMADTGFSRRKKGGGNPGY